MDGNHSFEIFLSNIVFRLGDTTYCGKGFGFLWWNPDSHNGSHGLDVHGVRRGHGHFFDNRVWHLPDVPQTIQVGWVFSWKCIVWLIHLYISTNTIKVLGSVLRNTSLPSMVKWFEASCKISFLYTWIRYIASYRRHILLLFFLRIAIIFFITF